MLYLFDIDGTLVDTGGAGMTALVETTTAIFGDSGPKLDLAGSTDLGIVLGIHAHFNVEVTQERIDAYFAVYQQRLDHNLAQRHFNGKAFEGAVSLVNALASTPEATLGLLTGNIASGARSKVNHYGFGNYFPFGAYGSDHHDRNLLGPIALERAMAHTGRSFTAANTWVIGDTPKDIRCAHAMGARCLAVATGQFTASQLRDHSADAVVESLDEALPLLGLSNS